MRTIRYYHQLGVLPRPQMHGRVGWYGPDHVRRLAFVRRLAERGYSLAAVADMVAQQIPAILTASSAGDGSPPSSSRASAGDDRISRAELAAAVPEFIDSPELVDGAMVRLGVLVPRPDGDYDVPQPQLLRAGIALVARGVPASRALDELQRLRAEFGSIAERFIGILRDDVMPTDAGGQLPADDLADLLENLLPAVLVATGSLLSEALHGTVARLVVATRQARIAPSGGIPGAASDH